MDEAVRGLVALTPGRANTPAPAQPGGRPSVPAGSRWGIVRSTSPLTVEFPGDSAATPVSRLGSYTPSVDDVVQVDRVGLRLVVQGAIV